jgi:hypothetical protein
MNIPNNGFDQVISKISKGSGFNSTLFDIQQRRRELVGEEVSNHIVTSQEFKAIKNAFRGMAINILGVIDNKTVA